MPDSDNQWRKYNSMANIRYGPQSTFEPLMQVQIDSRLHCKMCQCTVYAIVTGTRSNNSLDT